MVRGVGQGSAQQQARPLTCIRKEASAYKDVSNVHMSKFCSRGHCNIGMEAVDAGGFRKEYGRVQETAGWNGVAMDRRQSCTVPGANRDNVAQAPSQTTYHQTPKAT